MAKYRKKVVVVEAQQFFDNGADFSVPSGVCICMDVTYGLENRSHVHTLEGTLLVSNGDWIITGVKGEHYLCKPDIFPMIYEPVDQEAKEDVNA